jgi:chemotaxis receptor (MCP) glutamine deamidase CheD
MIFSRAPIFEAAQVGKKTDLSQRICQESIQIAEEILSNNKILSLEQDLMGSVRREIVFNPKDRKITVKKVI